MTTILKPECPVMTIRGIPTDLRRAVKIKAMQEGKSLQDKIEELMEAYAGKGDASKKKE